MDNLMDWLICLLLITTISTVNSSKAIDHGDSIRKSFCNPTKADKLNVHIISHTHLDAGWVRTYDEYYYDSVKDIMKTVMEALTNEKGLSSRKFTFVEMSFFSRYWNGVGPKQRQIIKNLVESGKLQFTSGGWVMNDEATPHYSMIIDQMSYGHRWINKTFGSQYLPTTGWQIDPFGHTKEFASILSQMGFNALLLGRIDYQDKAKRLLDRSLEFIWKTDQSLEQNNFLFTGITPSGYYPSDGVRMTGNSLEDNAKSLIESVKNQTKGHRSNHIMATMGGDFSYILAEINFRNLDKLIEYANSIQDDVHLVYSTPDCYIEAVHESNVNWTDMKTDDFLPYADNYDDYWSGYFTSRPAFKYLMNYCNSILQISKQLVAKADIYSDSIHLIRPLEESINIGVHHDAITGTSKQYVSDDYVQMLSRGLASAEKLIGIAYGKLFRSKEMPHFCHNLNISECLFLDKYLGHPIQIVLYNPLAHRVSHSLRLPLLSPNFEIQNSNEEVVESQLIPIPKFIQSLTGRKSSAEYELLFKAVLKPFTFTEYRLKNILEPRHQHQKMSTKYELPDANTDIVISNDRIKVIIDGTTGLLKGIQKQGLGISLKQNFYYYSQGSGKNSGAYAMHTGPSSLAITNKAIVSVVYGNISQEVIQEFTPYLKQIIRIYKNSDYLEFDWTVGPLPYKKDFELISRFDTDFESDHRFYTDSNGRQTEERIRDLRQTWNLNTSEKISSNYYPITSWIYIRDRFNDLQLTVMPDRTQGGSSLSDGSIELMIHRRLHDDDSYGMNENLNEPGLDGKGLVVRGKHYLMIEKIEESMKKVKSLSKELFWKPLPLFLLSKPNENELLSKSESLFDGISLTNKIHPSIHLLTLEELQPNLLFIRLEYILETTESMLETIFISLKDVFTGIEIESMVETSLTGAETLSDMLQRKYKWNCDECHNQVMPSDGGLFKITFKPNQIRSFMMKINRIQSKRTSF